MNANIFKAISDLAVSAKRRTDKEYADFLAFYRQLVETLPAEATELFGNMDGVEVQLKGGKTEKYGIELTVADFLWWKRVIEIEGLRFIRGTAAVQNDMLRRFSGKAETHRLSADERKALLALVEQASTPDLTA